MTGKVPAICLDCRFYDRRNNDLGLCRRHSPPPGGIGWPLVYARTDWCGDGEQLTHNETVARETFAGLDAGHD